ncbi:hypothetical protein CPA57_06450 [Bombella sp. TMW2.1880]|uniref:Transcription regulator HTH AraC N-terminal domain-containing protein n=1 Tax=Bombella favorum TaxID=2039164 RepID=A0ABR5ZNN6_9PROT|nr:hypothetical protein [Bombella favorum]
MRHRGQSHVLHPAFCPSGSRPPPLPGKGNAYNVRLPDPLSYSEGQYLISTLDLPVSGQITHASVETPYLALCVSVSLTERSNGHDTRPISDQTPPA